MAIATSTLIAGGLAVGGSLLARNSNNNAIKDSTRAQTQASNEQIRLYERIYEDQKDLYEPFRVADVDRLNLVREMFGQSAIDPDMAAGKKPPSQSASPFNFRAGQVGNEGGGNYAGSRFNGKNQPGAFASIDMGDGRWGQTIGQTPPFVQPGTVSNGGATTVKVPPPEQTREEIQAGALDRFNDSPFMAIGSEAFQRDANKIDASMAGQGMAFSGAREYALADTWQDRKTSQFNSYLNTLLGYSTSSAGANGQANAAGSYGANSAGAIGRSADAQSNSAYARANNNNQFTNGLFQAGGTIFGSI